MLFNFFFRSFYYFYFILSQFISQLWILSVVSLSIFFSLFVVIDKLFFFLFQCSRFSVSNFVFAPLSYRAFSAVFGPILPSVADHSLSLPQILE